MFICIYKQQKFKHHLKHKNISTNKKINFKNLFYDNL